MYRIREEIDREKYIMLIPAMLDAHFPLLKYAFYSPDYHPVVLENEENITDIGLHYVNNDMCYPAILNIGQMIGALQSGQYDLKRTVLLMPQAGDSCRGSNYTNKLRRAVKNAGLNVPVLSLNVKGLERNSRVRLRLYMVYRAMLAMFYGDALMILKNQTEPYEQAEGDTRRCEERWLAILSEELKSGRVRSLRHMQRRIAEMTQDFAAVERRPAAETISVQKIGVVGELYMKYCHIGNWNLARFLREEKCEYYINGISWYALYYIDTHLGQEGFFMRGGYRLAFAFLAKLQSDMIRTLRRENMYVMDAFRQFKEQAVEYVNCGISVGDGWLLGAEAAAHARGGYYKVVAVQPFGCMVNQVSGKGLYPSLARRIPGLQIESIDYDSGGSSINVKNRIKLLLDYKDRKKEQKNEGSNQN